MRCKLTLGDMPMYSKKKYDMSAFGQAVREARESRGMTRERLAEMLELSERHVMYIETRGQRTSVQRLFELAELFNISIDQYFLPDTTQSKSTSRRQLDAILDSLDDKKLSVITATASAIRDM